MKILITGACGFIGKNLVAELRNRGYDELYCCDKDTSREELNNYLSDCEFVFHLAGINRPEHPSEFMEGNYSFTSELLTELKRRKNCVPVLMTSSIQAELDNPYGISKKEGEKELLAYGQETGSRVLCYRLPNVFGKWCRPNYNSAIATFCYNIAHGLEIKVNDPTVIMNLVYIDDVVDEFIKGIQGNENRISDICQVPVTYTSTLGKIAELIQSFKESRTSLQVPDMGNGLEKRLYSTYLSYLPEDEFSYPLKMNEDARGSFTEFIRTPERGQVSVNVSKPGIVKGNHWHHTKNEKFLVVHGRACIQFRKIDSDQVLEYRMSGDKMEVVDIPTGYTHNIINEGEDELVTVMWANEMFDSEHPDTYFLKVDKDE